MRAFGLVSAIGLLSMPALGGCGDDGGGDGGMDAAVVDTGADTGRDSAMVDSGPRDSGGDAADAGETMDECDPFVGGECADGEKCSLVINRNNPDEFLLSWGCVDGRMARGRDVPCAINVDATPEDRTDDVVADNCQEGLFCFRDDDGIFRCDDMCIGTRVDCGTGGYCLLENADPAFGRCHAGDMCDVVFQTGCADGEACYALTATNGDVVSGCFEFVPPGGDTCTRTSDCTGASGGPMWMCVDEMGEMVCRGTGLTGDTCQFLNNCAPGNVCEPDAVDGGMATTASCHHTCAVGDAGVPDAAGFDGGMLPTGACPGAGDTCDPIRPEGDGGTGMILVPTTPGICR